MKKELYAKMLEYMLEKHGDVFLAQILDRVFKIDRMLDEPFEPYRFTAEPSKINGKDGFILSNDNT